MATDYFLSSGSIIQFNWILKVTFRALILLQGDRMKKMAEKHIQEMGLAQEATCADIPSSAQLLMMLAPFSWFHVFPPN